MKNYNWKLLFACGWLAVVWNTPVHVEYLAQIIESVLTMAALLIIINDIKQKELM